MKKIFSLTLVLILSACLCACTVTTEYSDLVACLDAHDYEGAISLIQDMASKHYASTPEDPLVQKAEQEKRQQYDRLISILENFSQPGAIISIWADDLEKTLQDNEAWEYLYRQFIAMGDYEDCAQIAANFTVLKNMYLGHTSVTVDNMGNTVQNARTVRYTYDADGRITTVKGNLHTKLNRMYGQSGTVHIEYAGNDTVSSITLTSGDAVTALITPTYNDGGKCISETILTNSGTATVSFAYDENGRLLSRTRTSGGSTCILAYTYNDRGLMIQETYSSGYGNQITLMETTDYTYNATGKLTGKTVTDTSWGTAIHQYTCVYNDAGDLIRETVTYGQTTFADDQLQPPTYTTEEITHIYQDFYIYNTQ